jgi:GTP:adenosylcobinamide-phosphate guanylyltransferase
MKTHQSIKSYSILSIVAAALYLITITYANAAIIVSGDISGTVGGEALSASLSGNLDEATWSGSESLSFSSLPSQLDDNLALTIIITIWKCTVKTNSLCSIFDASGGAYEVDRDWSFNGSTTPTFSVSASTSLIGSDFFVDEVVNGDFSVEGMPTSYSAVITPNGVGSALETISVEFDSGDTASSTGVYTWSGTSLSNMSTVNVSWSNASFTGNTYSADFASDSNCIPEPSTYLLLGIGFIFAFNQRLRSYQKKT